MTNRVMLGAGAAVVYTVVAAMVGVLQLRLALHYLSPALAGLWTLFGTCGTYIALLDLGLMPTLGREISLVVGTAGQTRSGAIPVLLRTFSICSRYLAATAWLASLAVGLLLLRASVVFGHQGVVALAWVLFSLGAATNLLGSPAYAGLYGLGHVADEKLIRAGSLLGGLLLTALLLRLGWGMAGAAFAMLLQGLAARTLAWWRLRQLMHHAPSEPIEVDWALARRLAGPSLKLAGIQVAGVAILQAANPVIAIRIGTSAIPAYESVSRIALTMLTLSTLVASASIPFLSMAYSSGDLAAVRRLLSRTLRCSMALILVPSVFAAVWGDRIVEAWLGPRVFPGFAVLWVLLLMVLLEVHHVIYASAVMATGRIVFVPAAVLSSVLNLSFAFLLAPRWGLLGIAAAVCFAQLLTNNWYAPYRAWKLFELSPWGTTRRLALPCLVLFTVQLLFTVALRRMPWSGSAGLSTLLANALLSCGLGAALALRLCLNAEERAALTRRLFARRLTLTETTV